jgi:hypothetical protein
VVSYFVLDAVNVIGSISLTQVPPASQRTDLAIIAAVAAIVSALIAMSTGFYTSRIARRIARDQKMLDGQLGLLVDTRALALEELRAALGAISEGVEAIQTVKDNLRLILAAVPGSLDKATAMVRFRASLERITEAYSSGMPHFSEAERKACHDAKNTVIYGREQLLEALHGSSDMAAISPEGREELWRLHEYLTDLQNLLRDRRFYRLAEATSPKLADLKDGT